MKYQLVCKKCGKVFDDFATWFEKDQQCDCGSSYVEAVYPEKPLLPDFATAKADGGFLDYYFDLLPLHHRSDIVTCGEGLIPIERWSHLEHLAKEHGIDCEVYVYRNDMSPGSASFKDVGAALAASVLKEYGIKEYCLASTGNAGTAFAVYLAKAGIHFTDFAPSFVDPEVVRSIERAGQTVVLSKGGYGDAKAEAAAFRKEHHVLMSTGNTDPLRIEAKKTVVFECLRQLGFIPNVYMQAVAGGTSPLAFDKGVRDLNEMYPDRHYQLPRLLLVQQDECDPMVTAWEKASQAGFPQDWEQQYEAKQNVKTRIGILTAANPGNYPLLAPLVRQSGGTFYRVCEAELAQYGRTMLREQAVLMGPASVVCYAGFTEALKAGGIRNGDRVLLNTGEGCGRSPWFEKEVRG